MDYELYEVTGEGRLKYIKSYPAIFTKKVLESMLNKEFPGTTRAFVILRPTGVATPEYFDAFAGVEKQLC